MGKSVAIDMTGQRFGALVVVRRAGSHPVSRAAMWLCRCDCGNETTAPGVALRKGERRSCGCRKHHLNIDQNSQEARVTKTKTKPVPTDRDETLTAWVVEESQGTTFLLRRVGSIRTALIEHDGERWQCSEDGPQQGRRGSATGQCVHVRVVARRLPLPTAQEIAARIMAPTAKRSFTGVPATSVEQAEQAERRSEVDIMAAGAGKRAERAREHDEAFQGITGEVTVRRMTDEDRRKLAESRARKSRSFVTPDGYAARFQG